MTENKSAYALAKEEGIPFIDKMKKLAETNPRAKEMLDKYAPTGNFDEDALLERNTDLVREFAWDAQEFRSEQLREQPSSTSEPVLDPHSFIGGLDENQKDMIEDAEATFSIVFNKESKEEQNV